MILAKCCHDFDILLWLTGRSCKKLSSFGSLDYFTRENAPQNSAARCKNCAAAKICPYDAYRIYAARPTWVRIPDGQEENWENAKKVLDDNSTFYDKCVFRCDNDVVDHQVVNMLFEENVTAQLTMTAFSKECHRCIKVHGTLGEMVADMEENSVLVKPFRSEDYVIDITKYATDLSVHGGGDKLLFEDFVSYITGGAPTETRTTLADSLISHRMSFAAEESRLAGGEPIDIR